MSAPGLMYIMYSCTRPARVKGDSKVTARSFRALGIASVLAMVMFALMGCGSSGSDTGQLQVSLVDAPIDADEVNVDISSVQVHNNTSGWVTLKSFDPSLRVNLLDYRTGGSSLLLADEPLQAGHYTQIRLMLSSAEIVIGDQTYPVDLTNVAQTGVRCNRAFTVADGELVALVLDFNAGKSFVNNPPGSDDYKLHPVMTMSPVNIATEVIGKVEVRDAMDNVLPLPDGTTVDVYTQGHIGDADYLVSGAFVETDGTFRIAVLAQGTYDFRVTAGTATKDLLNTVITPPSTDLGTIPVLALP